MRTVALGVWLALGVAVSGQLPPPGAPNPSAQAAKGTGLILGRVVDAGTGQPIAEATISIAQLGGGRGGGPPAPGPVQASDSRVITGADGRFVFRELPRGTFPISVNASGYVPGSAGQSRAAGPSSPVQLADGEHLTTLTISLWKYAVISGVVVDEAGEPAVGMMVRAFSKTVAGGRPRFNMNSATSTDDRGIYRIPSLTPGDYVVGIPQTQQTLPAAIIDSMMQGIASGVGGGSAFMDMVSSGGPAPVANGVRIGDLLLSSDSGSAAAPAKDGRIYVYQSLFFPAAPAMAQATSVTARSGEERSGVDFQLRLIPTLRVSGTVTGPSGPVSGVGVRLAPAAADGTAGDTGADVATTATRPDGTFTFLGVPEGQFIARVLKPPRLAMPAGMASSPIMQMMMGSGGTPSPDAGKLLFADVPVNVSGADVTGLSVVLREGMTASGRVEFDGTAAPPVGPQLQAITITLISADGRVSSPMGASGISRVSADGQFRTTAYPSGRYFVGVNGGGQGWIPKSAMVAGRDALSQQPLELKDADIAEIVVTFTDRASQITGQVRGDTGAAPAGTQVMLFPQDFRTWIANGMPPRRSRTVQTNSTAGFSMQGLLAGDYLIAAIQGGTENQDVAFFDELSRLATHVALGEGETRTQDLRVVTVKR